MDRDPLQQAWQSQTLGTKVNVDPELLLQEVQQSRQQFRSQIFWRDVREVSVALALIPVWIYLGIRLKLPWTWYLTLIALVWCAGFILLHRRLQKPLPSEPGNPLVTAIQESLAHVEQQIWLLRNIFWWSIFPFTIPISAFFLQAFSTAWRMDPPVGWPERILAIGMLTFCSSIVVAVYWFLYALNQDAVRKTLEPRRQELLAMLDNLSENEHGV